jgi:hypothetical protein
MMTGLLYVLPLFFLIFSIFEKFISYNETLNDKMSSLILHVFIFSVSCSLLFVLKQEIKIKKQNKKI